MDLFCENDLFDDDVPAAPALGAESVTEPLTVPTAGVPLRRGGGSAMRLFAYVLAVLAAVLVGGYVIRSVGGLPGHYAPPDAKRDHRHARPRRPHARRGTIHRRATGAHAPVPARPSQTVVEPPSNGAERPSRDESVGSERPNSVPSVGNTEQFAYLGR
jgi:hypothetical protein